MSKRSEMFLLFECAAGYVLLHVKEWNTLAQNSEVAQSAYLDFAKFSKVVSVKAVYLFPDADIALKSCQAISNSESDEVLRNFLSQNLPRDKTTYELGCADPALGKNLSQHKFTIIYDKNILEITRLCRLHFKKLAREFKDQNLVRFQVGLSHNYLRTKLKMDVNRQDKPVQNAVTILENIDKALNTFSMRAKEWYSWHFPELSKIIPDNIKFAQVAHCMGIRDDFSEENLPELREILDHDESLLSEIMAAKDISMGQNVTDLDMIHIKNFTSQVVKLAEQRKLLTQYMGTKLSKVVPNLQSLLGDILAAKLIAHSGSLSNLAKSPASTIQILGAEKALFRALKTKGNTPKYGLLFQSSFVGRASAQNKGRISRYLANKCSLAARIDTYASYPTHVFGEKMRDQVEARLKYLADGLAPRKNIEAMREAFDIYKAQLEEATKKSKRKSKRKHVESDNSMSAKKHRTSKSTEGEKHHKKSKNKETADQVTVDMLEEKKSKKSKSKKRESQMTDS